LLFCVGLLVSLALPGAASAACTPGAALAKYDDEAAMLAGGGGTFVQDSQWVAQAFVIAGSNELGGVSLFMKNQVPTGDTVTVSIRSDIAGVSGPILGQTTASTTSTTTYEWLVFDFGPLGLQLASGTTYWIVANNSITASGQGYAWQEISSASVYTDGISRASANQGASWGGALNADFGFRVLGCAPQAGVPINPPAINPPTTGPPAIPSNVFTLDTTQRNKKKGTATLNITLPNSGALTVSGNGVTAASAGQATIAQAVSAGPTRVLIKAKGKKKAKLNRTGKVKVDIAITFTPTNGTANTQAVEMNLRSLGGRPRPQAAKSPAGAVLSSSG
jgi:hypothetical protein